MLPLSSISIARFLKRFQITGTKALYKGGIQL